jgi:hypothetical protein
MNLLLGGGENFVGSLTASPSEEDLEIIGGREHNSRVSDPATPVDEYLLPQQGPDNGPVIFNGQGTISEIENRSLRNRLQMCNSIWGWGTLQNSELG